MRINKTKAENAANTMACKVYDEKIQEANEIQKILFEEIMSNKLPSVVLQCCQEYPDMIAATNEVYAYWNGQRFYQTISFRVPMNGRQVTGNLKDADEYDVEITCRKIYALKYDKDQFKEKVRDSLLAMKTRAKIEELFPEACPFIDWPFEKKLPMKSPDDLRKIMQSIKK